MNRPAARLGSNYRAEDMVRMEHHRMITVDVETPEPSQMRTILKRTTRTGPTKGGEEASKRISFRVSSVFDQALAAGDVETAYGHWLEELNRVLREIAGRARTHVRRSGASKA
eukprot:3359848-Alexandrium_andersonii.AAC.1